MSFALVIAGCSGGDGSTGESITQTTATQATASASATTDGSMTTLGPEPTTTGSSGSTTGPTTGPTSTSVGTGDTTTGGGGGAGFCQEACDGDGDCLADGVDLGFVCKDGRCRPGGTPDKCTDDLFCQIVFASSGLTLNCESTADCGAGRVCVALGGFALGGCVPLAGGMGECANELQYEALTLPLVEGGEALVCVLTGVFCDLAGGIPPLFYCNAKPAPCSSNDQCAMFPSQPICGGDGACICDDDAHCKDVVGQPHCVGGRCACTSDADCEAFASADACVDGVCGCSSATVCPPTTYHDGTEFVCEPL